MAPIFPSSNEFASDGRILSRIPARVRGEVFDQQPRVTYSFCDNDIVANLLAIHDSRSVVVQVDVTASVAANNEWPRLSQRRLQRSKRIMESLRSKYVGVAAKCIRILKRKRQAIQVEGPFIPHQFGLALMTLVIKVSRDANFDSVYQETQRFLELHHDNDDRTRYAQLLNRSVAGSIAHEIYSWSHEELIAVEQMARLEPAKLSINGDPSLFAGRRQYNYALLRKCHFSKTTSEPTSSSSAQAATRVLRREFVNLE